jgi:hypothetical protein
MPMVEPIKRTRIPNHQLCVALLDPAITVVKYAKNGSIFLEPTWKMREKPLFCADKSVTKVLNPASNQALK